VGGGFAHSPRQTFLPAASNSSRSCITSTSTLLKRGRVRARIDKRACRGGGNRGGEGCLKMKLDEPTFLKATLLFSSFFSDIPVLPMSAEPDLSTCGGEGERGGGGDGCGRYKS
jgi:hypothetical protein